MIRQAGFIRYVAWAGLSAAMLLAPSAAFAFDSGGFAGGLIGGMLGSAMGRGFQPRPVIVYRPRHVYRVVPRRVAAAPHARQRSPATSSAAVVNTAADPFATAKPTGPLPIPVANKP